MDYVKSKYASDLKYRQNNVSILANIFTKEKYLYDYNLFRFVLKYLLGLRRHQVMWKHEPAPPFGVSNCVFLLIYSFIVCKHYENGWTIFLLAFSKYCASVTFSSRCNWELVCLVPQAFDWVCKLVLLPRGRGRPVEMPAVHIWRGQKRARSPGDYNGKSEVSGEHVSSRCWRRPRGEARSVAAKLSWPPSSWPTASWSLFSFVGGQGQG